MSADQAHGLSLEFRTPRGSSFTEFLAARAPERTGTDDGWSGPHP